MIEIKIHYFSVGLIFLGLGKAVVHLLDLVSYSKSCVYDKD